MSSRRASRTRRAEKVCLIGIDVGGTKIKLGAVEHPPGPQGAQLIVSRQIPTPRVAPKAFYDAIATLMRRVAQETKRHGWRVLPLVAIAQPGRFRADGTLARGTTPNLGTAPGQFDGVSPVDELRRRLGGVVVAENDALAQMRYGVQALLSDPRVRPHLLGQTVVYLGPGTGMGAGVARVDRNGDFTPITDGHLFDLRVAGYGDGTLTAEEVFTGLAIAQRIREANRALAVPIRPSTARQLSRLLMVERANAAQRLVAQRVAKEQGVILAYLIETIHAGRIVKVRLERTANGQVLRHLDEPDRAWPAEDQAAIRGTTRFVLGGSIGADPALGGRIRAQALKRLKQRGLPRIEIFQLPVASSDAGLLGAATAIPEDIVQRCDPS